MYIYHGTNQSNAMSIMESGFRKGTYFTPFLDSALVFGGEYVFAVWVKGDKFPGFGEGDFWQVRISEDMSRDRIVSLVHYNVEMLYVNGDFNVRENWQREPCRVCGGRGEIHRNDMEKHAVAWLPKTHWLHREARRNTTLCPECHGYGDMDKAREMMNERQKEEE